MIDTSAVGSAPWWFKRLADRLLMLRPRFDMLDAYYTGEASVPNISSKACKQAFRNLMAMSRTNFAELVVEAPRERMLPVGFRTGAADDDDGDSEAWAIWQANALDADSTLVHRASLSMGSAYVIVGPVDAEIGAPLITPEDPREVITEQDPRRRRRTMAALKVFRDEVAGVEHAYVFLPGAVFRFARDLTAGFSGEPDRQPVGHVTPEGWSPDGIAELGISIVPVVPFPNRQTMFGGVRGEFEPHLGLLDRINYTILNRLEITTLQAFRQRAIKGVPNLDENGNPVDYSDVFAYDPGALWLLPETAEMWESGQVDLTPIRQAIRDDVQDLAAVTRTPLFYLTPEANNGSAEGASLAREGLVFKTQDRIVQAGEGWEQVMSLAFLFAGDPERAARGDMEVLWASPERFSLAERYDAAVKATAAGMPWRSVMRSVLQFSPQEVDQMEAEKAADALLTPEPAAPVAASDLNQVAG